jgi:transcription initiation factor TFIIB
MDHINIIKSDTAMLSSKTYQDNTRKKKTNKKKDIKQLWNIFDEEFTNNNKNKLVCVYRNSNKLENKNDICSYCETNLFLGDDGLLTCSNHKCGIIYKDNLDHTAEWRFYGADDNQHSDPTRCGMPINPLLKESSYSCKVLCGGKSTYEMHKIRRYTDWQSMPYKEKSQYDEFQLITNIAQNAGIPKMIIDEATRIHKKISEAKTYRGLNRDGIIAASIYISCRMNNYPRTAKEIANIFTLDNASATKGCKNALSIINEIEHENNLNEDIVTLNKTTPSSFIERFCSKLNINSELTNLCKFVAFKIEKFNLIPENTPHSIAGGIIYFVSQICKLNISKTSINTVSKISEVTINKCYKKLETYKTELIPEIILKKYLNQ